MANNKNEKNKTKSSGLKLQKTISNKINNNIYIYI